jgi:type I restriction enzyme S subunit
MSGNSKYPFISLSKVLVQDKEYVTELEPRLYPKLSVKLYGRGVVLDEPTNGAAVRMKRHQLAQPGQVILSEIWAKKGAIGIVPDEGAGALATSHFFLFDVDESRLLRSYMGWLLSANYFEPVLSGEARGTTGYAAVRPKQFLQCEIPLPPLEEQRCIVARIEELAAKVEAARALRKQAAQQVEALFASAADAVFRLKSGWTEAKVGDFCEKPQYGYTESATYEPVGPRFLRITDIQNGQVNWDTVPFCDCPEPGKYLLRENDILFARTGATTGKSFLVRDCPEAVFASYLIRLRVQRLVVTEYLYWYFQSPSYWSQITEGKEGTGQPNMNGRKLASISVPIPPPDEQRRIIAYLDELQSRVDAVKQHQAAAAAALDVLLPSILDQAFKGEL